MDREEFRCRGKEMVDYICEYLGNLASRRVTPSVEPGYLSPLLPKEAPLNPEPWDIIMEDVEKYIMPGVSHFQPNPTLFCTVYPIVSRPVDDAPKKGR